MGTSRRFEPGFLPQEQAAHPAVGMGGAAAPHVFQEDGVVQPGDVIIMIQKNPFCTAVNPKATPAKDAHFREKGEFFKFPFRIQRGANLRLAADFHPIAPPKTMPPAMRFPPIGYRGSAERYIH
jgi:hypothetical protein